MRVTDAFLTALLLVAVMAAAIFLVAPVFISDFLKNYGTAWATIFAASIGFGSVYMSLRQNRISQRRQAEEDRKARTEHWNKELQLQERQWEENLKAEVRQLEVDSCVLATALAAELGVAVLRLDSFIGTADNQAAQWDAIILENPDSKLDRGSFQVSWEVPCSVFNANLNKLGLLPLVLTRETIWVYQRVRRDSAYEETYRGNISTILSIQKQLAETLLPSVKEIHAHLEAFAEGDGNEPELPL